MIVSVIGAKNRNLTKLLKLATNHYARVLLSYQILPYVHVKIIVKPNLDYDFLATCSYLGSGNKPREFEIELKHSNTEIMIESLAHEMVHLKQFAKGELKERTIKRKRITLWNNKPVYRSYWNQPWEKEAFNLQYLLKESFMGENDDAKILFRLV